MKIWPTSAELVYIERKYKREGCPWCVGSIDCSKLFWKNCTAQDKGQYLNIKGGRLASIQCEAWCDEDLHFWHWNVGRVGTNNYINVLIRSRLLKDIFSGLLQLRFREVYRVLLEGTVRNLSYLLADSIYPDWALFSKPINHTDVEEEKKFSRRQESARKDVERLFGVLKTTFQILRRELMMWELDDVISVAQTCIILHNLLVRMQRNGDFKYEAGDEYFISEFYECDESVADEAAAEYEVNRQRIR